MLEITGHKPSPLGRKQAWRAELTCPASPSWEAALVPEPVSNSSHCSNIAHCLPPRIIRIHASVFQAVRLPTQKATVPMTGTKEDVDMDMEMGEGDESIPNKGEVKEA